MLNANTAHIKKLSGPEKISGLLRNGPLINCFSLVSEPICSSH